MNNNYTQRRVAIKQFLQIKEEFTLLSNVHLDTSYLEWLKGLHKRWSPESMLFDISVDSALTRISMYPILPCPNILQKLRKT
jgi:hypothetical protein